MVTGSSRVTRLAVAGIAAERGQEPDRPARQSGVQGGI